MTDADIEALFEHFESNHYRYCQFKDIVNPHDLQASVEFYRALTESIQGTKRTIWKTFLTIVIGGLSIITVRGIADWLKDMLGK